MNMQHFNGTCNDYNYNVDKKQAEMRQKGVKTPAMRHIQNRAIRQTGNFDQATTFRCTCIYIHVYCIASKCCTTNSQGRHGHTLQSKGRYQL